MNQNELLLFAQLYALWRVLMVLLGIHSHFHSGNKYSRSELLYTLGFYAAELGCGYVVYVFMRYGTELPLGSVKWMLSVPFIFSAVEAVGMRQSHYSALRMVISALVAVYARVFFKAVTIEMIVAIVVLDGELALVIWFAALLLRMFTY